MKKIWILISCCFMILAGSVSFAAVNPFVDVPPNHWAYDAIGQLAASGVLSGYPDGVYRGKQPVTRYEMASALARALAVTDLSKAGRQDVEALKRLVLEFKDELNALGVKVDDTDMRAALLESRLGGWEIGGELRLDIEDWKGEADEGKEGDVFMGLARLEFHRRFGEDEGIYFYARIDEDEDGVLYFDKFYADVPFAWNSTLTVGRFGRDFEDAYRFQIGGATDIANESWLTDRTVDGVAFSKSFALWSLNVYAARPVLLGWIQDAETDMWEFNAFASFQFSERFGLDLGAQAFIGDDLSVAAGDTDDYKMNNILTLYGGLRFDVTTGASLKGIYHYQSSNVEKSPSETGAWQKIDTDSASAWKIVLDVNQDLLKFTSLWLEYSRLERGFYLPYGNEALTLVDDARWNSFNGSSALMESDIKIWRVGAVQKWNDKWSTWLYAAAHTLSNGDDDYKGTQWGLGVEYQYNENIAFALGYIKMDWNSDANEAGYENQHRFQLRTAVVF